MKRSPKFFVPTPYGRQVVIPFNIFTSLLSIFFFLTSVFFLLRSDLLQVSNLKFEFGEVYNESLVRQGITEKVIGRGMVFLSESALEKIIKDEFLTIAGIDIEKVYPNTLIIKVEERAPLAKIRFKNGEVFLVDKEGLIFSKDRGEVLPVIDSQQETANLGDKVLSEGVSNYIKVLDLVRKHKLSAETINLDKDVISIKIKEGPYVLLSAEKQAQDQLEILSQIILRLKLKGQTPTFIDLRFERPVVKF